MKRAFEGLRGLERSRAGLQDDSESERVLLGRLLFIHF